VRILLIGGSGFIGPHVAADLIRRGHDVTIFHRGSARSEVAQAFRPAIAGLKPCATILGDRARLADFADDLRASEPDVVVDLILSSGRQAHTLMTLFRGVARRVVALSSCDVYRACGVLHRSEAGPLEPLPLTEDSPLRTTLQTYPPDRVRILQHVFGWLDDEYDKIPVERVILGDTELPGTVLRLPMVYGPGDPLHRQFPLVKRMDDGRRVILFEEKRAAWRSPRGYVENVAAAIALAATCDHATGRIYNVGEAQSLSELDWARQIASVAGWAGEFIVLPADRTPSHLHMPGNLEQHWVVDTTRIREELGCVEPVSRTEALARTVEWERAHPPPIDPRAFDYEAEDAAIAARTA
jgi:nucleoside-diphosphate-sugar epimerase